MNIELQTEYSLWLSLLCLGLGALYAAVLYYRDKTFYQYYESVRPWLYVMTTLRFLSVSMIAFLLLTPLVKTAFQNIQQPIVILGQDISESILTGFKGQNAQLDTNRVKKYQNDLKKTVDQLSEKYTVRTYSFGSEVKTGIKNNYTQRQTNLSRFFRHIYTQYTNQNVGAVVTATDGIYNQGQNPRYLDQGLQAPIYPIALGDTTPKKDIVLQEVFHNDIVYLGNQFPLHVNIEARNCRGQTTRLQVVQVKSGQSNQELYNKSIEFEDDYVQREIPVTLEARETGVQHYKVSLSSVDGEVTRANNSQDVFIEVLESKRKVLLLANSPHPDLGALKQAIESKQNYKAEIAFVDNFTGSVEEYNVIILHQLPSSSNNLSQLYQSIVKQQKSVLFVVGSQTNIGKFNALQPLLNISVQSSSPNEVQAKVNSNFSLFTLSKPLKERLTHFPPLFAPFGDYQTQQSHKVCLEQKVGQTGTGDPLLLFNQQRQQRIGILCAEGIWRWRTYHYIRKKNHKLINELLSKVVQYLSVKADKRQFRVELSQNKYDENESVQLKAELYNQSYELVNTPEVTIKIENSEGKVFPFTFSKTKNAYTLDAGTFPVGNYSYQASTQFNGKTYIARGEFSVVPLRVEAVRTTANHQLLYNLARQSGGQLFYPGQIKSLVDSLQKSQTMKPVSYTEYETRPFLHLKWVFFLILGLLTAEWFLRKWQGGY